MTHNVGAQKEHLSNWLRFINCPRHVTGPIFNICRHMIFYIIWQSNKNPSQWCPTWLILWLLITIQKQFINVQYRDTSKVENKVRMGVSIQILPKQLLHFRCYNRCFIEDFLKTSWHLWEQLKPLTRGTSSGLHSSRLQDRCRRLQDVFIEDFLKTSSHLWEQLKPVTTGTSSGLHSSRLQDRCRRLQDVFIEDFLKTSSHLWEQLKTVN